MHVASWIWVLVARACCSSTSTRWGSAAQMSAWSTPRNRAPTTSRWRRSSEPPVDLGRDALRPRQERVLERAGLHDALAAALGEGIERIADCFADPQPKTVQQGEDHLVGLPARLRSRVAGQLFSNSEETARLVGGEEEGLLGSEYYSVTPVYPLAKTVGVINMDALDPHGASFHATSCASLYSLAFSAESVVGRLRGHAPFTTFATR